MFIFTLLIGLYSYSIFIFGILGVLNPVLITIATLAFLISIAVVNYRGVIKFFSKSKIQSLKMEFLTKIVFFLLALQIIINLIGALGPELAFDALWYHLTLPKLYLENGEISYIPGGVFYYSVMPKLVDMLYIPALLYGNEIIAKIIHFAFGLGVLVILYSLSRKVLSRKISALVVLIFYSNLVVAWQSITAYIDLGRTFFEVLALYFLINFLIGKKVNNLYMSGITAGFAIASKLLAFTGLIAIVVVLLINKIELRKVSLLYFIAIIIASPWFVYSYVNTGNPFYPFFSGLYPISPASNLVNFVQIVRSADPISPIYLITLPLIIVSFKKFNKTQMAISLYSLIVFIIWFFTPQTGGGRYIMPYLAAFSIVSGIAISISSKSIQKVLIIIVLIIAVSTIFYRTAANFKYMPVLAGIESKNEFLSQNLNFDFGDFYDTDDFFSNNLKETDKVLIYGSHNLYYVNFQFVHESYVNTGDKFNYVLTQDIDLPKRFSDWDLIYENEMTNVKLYTKDKAMWEY